MNRIFTIVAFLILAKSFAPAQKTLLVLTNVTVIDMTGAPPHPGMTVVIKGGRLLKIEPAAKVRVLPNAQIIDGTGKYLIPAFWDLHVHILEAERSLPLFVVNGVLNVRDLGVYELDDILRYRRETASGKIIGPRILTAGKILDGDPPVNAPYSLALKTPEESRRAVRDLKQRGVDCLKVYDALPREIYFAIIDEAKKLKLPVVGHVPTALTSVEVSDAGQKSIEHLGKIMEDSSGAPDEMRKATSAPTSTQDFSSFPRKFAKVYEVSIATYSEKKAGEIFSHFVKNKTWQVPTLITKYGRTFVDELDRKDDSRAKYIPAADRRYWKPEVGFFFRYRTPEYIEMQKKYFQKELELTGAMHRAGVRILTGTDSTAPYTYPGFSLHDELALFVESGFTPMDALIAATREPAEYLGETKTAGTIQKGKSADLILLDANPLEDIRNTTKINAVIQNGRFLSREILQKMLDNVEAEAKKVPSPKPQ